MKFTRTEIPDVIVSEPQIFKDDRGYFAETFRQDQLEKFIGYTINFCQENESKSRYGVLRGLHYQLAPYAQTKLVLVVSGSVLDIAVDIRKNSSTFGQHVTIELSSQNKRQLLVPKGFAHGIVVLSEVAIIAYKVDNYYNPTSERGIAYNDATLAIDWRVTQDKLQFSEKDLQQPTFLEAEYF